MGGVRGGRGGGSRMNAPTGGKAHQRPEARRLRVLSVLANGAERGSRPGGEFPPSQYCLPGTPASPCASPGPHQHAPSLSVSSATREPPPTASAPSPPGRAASRPPRHHPQPRGQTEERRGAGPRRGREARERARARARRLGPC